MEIILSDTTVDGELSLESLTNYAKSKSDYPPETDWSNAPNIKPGPKFQFQHVTPEEIANILKNTKNTSPGISNIGYADIDYCDPGCQFLATLFNKIIDTGVIPPSWKKFLTVMIPKPGKSGNYKDIGSWRPIALMECIAKLFTSCLCTQLEQWLVKNNLISKFQKGIGPSDGCAEHNNVMRILLEEYEHLHIAFLDLTDAFGSIPINHILEVLRRKGLDSFSCSLIANLYSDCSSTYTCNDCTTEDISIRRGVRQGCPLSMLLFSVGIDPILAALQDNDAFGIDTEAGKITCLAYADDIALVATSNSCLQAMVSSACDMVEWTSMKFNPAKCGYLSTPLMNESIHINNIPIPIVTDEGGYRYLGVDFTRKTKFTPERLFLSAIKDLKKITKSILFPWQKIEAYRIFIHSRFTFYFRNYNIPNRELTDYGHHETTKSIFKSGLDVEIRRYLKKICGTVPNSSNDYIYADKKKGGLGLVSARDEYAIQSIIQAYRNMVCSDETSRHLTFINLFNTLDRYHGTKKEWTLSDCLNWINTGDKENGFKSWWTKIRNSIKYLKGIGLQIQFVTNELGICLKVHISNDSMILSEHSIDNITFHLHRIYNKMKFDKWSKQRMAGMSAISLAEHNFSSKVLYNESLSIEEWRFLHSARTNSLPTNYKPKKPRQQSMCRACGQDIETQIHVLCWCKPNSTLIQARHNAIAEIVTDALLAEKPILKIIMNRECDWSVSGSRVDLQVYNHGTKELWLIDIKTPYDTIKALKDARDNNKKKYKSLLTEAKAAHKGWTVILGAIVVGCLGSWPADNDNLLKNKLHLSGTTIKNLTKMCIVSNIKYSNSTWHKHNTGQYNPLMSNAVTTNLTDTVTADAPVAG